MRTIVGAKPPLEACNPMRTGHGPTWRIKGFIHMAFSPQQAWVDCLHKAAHEQILPAKNTITQMLWFGCDLILCT